MEETIRKGYWKADEATEKKLLEEYLESVNKHGVGCSEHTCGNPRLSKYVMERAKALGIPTPVIDAFEQAMERATRKDISQAAHAAEDFVQKNEHPGEPVPVQTTQTTPVSPAHQGFLMEVTEHNQADKPRSNMAGEGEWDALWVSIPVLALLAAWRWRYRQRV
jgi:cobalamin biosynthesis Mg chelatase CobN